ncbi:hypothetical protein MKZ08_08070 [Viridibacillus sp. FSL R5-0477]|uniref:Uncharacterized protein n=1 Tax=Viridibacillus arenosi FSL R5-213 TaxID=1227360 RepID=W4EUP4_9BACL|nr:hypothetical protein C176_12808 [Viridibacillus arenosi FSL R5-213]
MSRKTENTAFQCEQCGAQIEPLTNGSFRNQSLSLLLIFKAYG